MAANWRSAVSCSSSSSRRHRAQDNEVAAAPERLGVAQRMVEHAVDQLQGTVLAMRTMPLGGGVEVES